MDTAGRHFHTLLRVVSALVATARRRPLPPPATEPADLGTAFGLDAAMAPEPHPPAPLAH